MLVEEVPTDPDVMAAIGSGLFRTRVKRRAGVRVQ
jgi:hypothetical protein